jgi:hypothetical protein
MTLRLCSPIPTAELVEIMTRCAEQMPREAAQPICRTLLWAWKQSFKEGSARS